MFWVFVYLSGQEFVVGILFIFMYHLAVCVCIYRVLWFPYKRIHKYTLTCNCMSSFAHTEIVHEVGEVCRISLLLVQLKAKGSIVDSHPLKCQQRLIKEKSISEIRLCPWLNAPERSGKIWKGVKEWVFDHKPVSAVRISAHFLCGFATL